MTFFLNQRILIRGIKEHFADGLGAAADYRANFEPMFAWEDNLLCSLHFQTDSGGLWIELTDKDGLRHQFAHLHFRQIAIGTKLKKGEVFAISGNSGTPYWDITEKYAPHAHHQILKSDESRIDPEEFWDNKNMISKKIQLNNPIDDGLLTAAKDFFALNGIEIIFTLSKTENPFAIINMDSISTEEYSEKKQPASGSCGSVAPYQIGFRMIADVDKIYAAKVLSHEILHALWYEAGLQDIHLAEQRLRKAGDPNWEMGQLNNQNAINYLLNALKNPPSAGTSPVITMNYVIIGKEQYLIGKSGFAYHIYNVATLTILIDILRGAGVNLGEPEILSTLMFDSGKEIIIVEKE
ncbi:MAG: hypothetical protein HY919_03015 [Elusimicrobia bacterium]|nr:hypothetical protein [Elusimicrobiota bacterium]